MAAPSQADPDTRKEAGSGRLQPIIEHRTCEDVRSVESGSEITRSRVLFSGLNSHRIEESVKTQTFRKGDSLSLYRGHVVAEVQDIGADEASLKIRGEQQPLILRYGEERSFGEFDLVVTILAERGDPQGTIKITTCMPLNEIS